MGRRRRKGQPIDGWMVIDKPLGMTSAHVVAKVKRLLNAAKVGHGGTLDPMATGVLPIALGEATKLLPYVVEGAKVYDFTVAWGAERDTDDREGEVVATSDKRPALAEIDAALPGFTGVIQQKPPAFSAIKVDGQRAYDLARAGETVDLPARSVEILSFERLDGEDGGAETRFRVRCGKGTYIRALARDLGRTLGTRGHIAALSRESVGGLRRENAISLESLEELVHKAPRDSYIAPLATALDDIPALAVTAEEARKLKSGNPVRHLGLEDGPLAVLFQGDMLAMAQVEAGQIKPVRVFNLDKKRNDDVDYG